MNSTFYFWNWKFGSAGEEQSDWSLFAASQRNFYGDVKLDTNQKRPPLEMYFPLEINIQREAAVWLNANPNYIPAACSVLAAVKTHKHTFPFLLTHTIVTSSLAESKVNAVQWQWLSVGLISAVWIFWKASQFWHKPKLREKPNKTTTTEETGDRRGYVSVVVGAGLCWCFGFLEFQLWLSKNTVALPKSTSQKDSTRFRFVGFCKRVSRHDNFSNFIFEHLAEYCLNHR